MAHTWKSALVLGLLGAAVTIGCTVETTSDDDDGGDSGEGASGGTSGSAGKSTAGTSSGGKSSGGSSGSSGSGSGGKAGSGSAGTSSSGTAGESGAPSTGGTSSGSGGEGGAVDTDTIPECDPDSGQLDNMPYDNCEPLNPGNACEECIQTSCCEESKACFSYAPGNVCGWGGPDATSTSPGDGEITCYQECIFDYVDENGFCDEAGENDCIGQCLTDGLNCGQIGNQTQDLAGCMWTNCAEDCFGTDSCEG